MTIKNFPSLDAEEFATACHQLDRRYRQATLGPLRRRWRLGVCTALDVQPSSAMMFGWLNAGFTTYMQITRPLEADTDAGGLSLDLANFSMSAGDNKGGMDKDMADAEDADQETLQQPEGRVDVGLVTYEIHLHPTYQVPCLWFSMHGLPAYEDALSIDTVFRYLVPDQYKDGLRKTGGMGGISIDNHPLTGVPCFFVHPCLLGEAISGFECDEANYLTVWIGLTGGPVGLWVPTAMMAGI